LVSQELSKLLALQKTDEGLDGLGRRERDAQARLDASLFALENLKEATKQEKRALDDALKSRKLLDLDLKSHEEKVRKYQGQLYEVKTNKEYTALKEEIDRARQEIQKTEEQVLVIMIREDELRGAQGRRTAELVESEKGAKVLEAETKAEMEACAGEREVLAARRTEQAAVLPAPLIRRYDQIRKIQGGLPMAKIVESPTGGEAVCAGCNMTVRPQLIVEIYKAEALVSCESCGRILFLESQPAPAEK
jgi:predicted  nucleic acid-binding Zn-ribbon protein